MNTQLQLQEAHHRHRSYRKKQQQQWWCLVSVLAALSCLSTFTFSSTKLSAAQTSSTVSKVLPPPERIGIEDLLIVKIEQLSTQQQETNALRISSRHFENKGQISSTYRFFLSNGSIHQKYQYEYALKPLSIGKASFSVYFNDTLLAEHTLTIQEGRVLNNHSATLSSSTAAAEDFAKTQFIVSSEVDKPTLYINEPTRYRVYLYRRVELQHLSVSSFSHRNLQLVEKPLHRLDISTVVTNGKRYKKQLVLENIIYPLKAGHHELKGGSLHVIVPQRWFFTPEVQQTLVIPTVTIQASAYPRANMPAEFHNAYGTFTLKLSYEPSPAVTVITPSKKAPRPAQANSPAAELQLAVNTPLTLLLSIEGSGNFNAIHFPELQAHFTPTAAAAAQTQPAAAGFFLRKGTVTAKLQPAKTFSTGRKTLRYTLLGTSSGTLKLRPVTLHYFSANTQRYDSSTAYFPPLTLTAPKGSLNANAAQIALKTFARKQLGITNTLTALEQRSLPPHSISPIAAKLPHNKLIHTTALNRMQLLSIASPLWTILFYYCLAFLGLGGFWGWQAWQQKKPNRQPAMPINTSEVLRRHVLLHGSSPENHNTAALAQNHHVYRLKTYRQALHALQKLQHPALQAENQSKDSTALTTALAASEEYLKSNLSLLAAQTPTITTPVLEALRAGRSFGLSDLKAASSALSSAHQQTSKQVKKHRFIATMTLCTKLCTQLETAQKVLYAPPPQSPVPVNEMQNRQLPESPELPAWQSWAKTETLTLLQAVKTIEKFMVKHHR